MFHEKGLAMNDLEFAALLVSRVCHDLVSPVGAVVNGLEVLEDETDAAMRADALRLVASSAEQAAARLQFARLAYGAAVLVAADCLPRGGTVKVETSADPASPSFTVVATGTVARQSLEAERALLGEPGGGLDGRSIQPYLTYQLSRGVNAGLTTTSKEGEVRFVAG